VSFKERGGQWPEHCVRDTEGAQFHPELTLPAQAVIVSKGEHPDADQYSAFGTGELQPLLEQHNVSRLWVGGVALDVCVKATVLDALKAGFEVHLMTAGTAPVNEDDGRHALDEMQSAGAILD
jgi:nicotinamidase/pyrazinamidase